jgi:hypothetical protein
MPQIDYVKMMLCDDCPAQDVCANYGKGADHKCCFGSWYPVGLCTQCALKPDGIAALCKSFDGVIFLESEE